VRISQVDARIRHKLKAVGADFLICPDNTIHQALPRVLRRSPLPGLGRAYARAWETLSATWGSPPGFTALRGLYLYHLNLLEMEQAQGIAAQKVAC